MQTRMLAPAAVLVLWSLLMLFWLTLTRFSAFSQAGIRIRAIPPGSRGTGLDGRLPDRVMWKSHNYSHLMEQPTIFYPAVVILALSGASAADVMLAWVYVGIRIVHSVWQATVNRLPVRLMLFSLSTVVLVILAIHAVMLTAFAA